MGNPDYPWTEPGFVNPRYQNADWLIELIHRGPSNVIEETFYNNLINADKHNLENPSAHAAAGLQQPQHSGGLLPNGVMPSVDRSSNKILRDRPDFSESFGPMKGLHRLRQDMAGSAPGAPRDDVMELLLEYMMSQKGYE